VCVCVCVCVVLLPQQIVGCNEHSTYPNRLQGAMNTPPTPTAIAA